MDYGQRPADECALLFNGRFYTMDRRVPRADAVFIRGDRIEAIGARPEVETCAAGHVRRIDLEGRCVVPGFIDAHVHVLGLGLSLHQVDLGRCRNVPDLVERMRAGTERLPKDAWAVGRGWRLEELWKPGEAPDVQALDAAFPDRPAVAWSKDSRSAWANTQALRLAGIASETPDPPGGRIGRNPRTGTLTGMLVDAACEKLRAAALNASPAQRREAVPAALREAHRWGVTGLHDVEGELALDIYEESVREGRLDQRIVFYIAGRNLDDLLKGGLRTGHGNEWLRFGGITLFADGTLESRSAAMLEPYDDDPADAGLVLTDRDALRETARRAAEGGIAVAVHAVGDRAVRMTLDVLEEIALPDPRRALRHRIEHFQHVCAEDVPRLKPLGAAASVQPCHLLGDMTPVERCLRSRGDRAHRLASALRSGVALAFGTDAPVEAPNPFRNLYAAVTRRREDGTPHGGWYPDERISIEDAVRAHTLGAAWAAGEDALKGTLSPGKLADLAVLSQDIFAVPPEDLLKTRVELTVVGGKVVWKA